MSKKRKYDYTDNSESKFNNEMDSEVLDYMKLPLPSISDDSRSYSKLRNKAENQQYQAGLTKSKSEIQLEEAENFSKVLATAIKPDNKGYQLLKRMGYEPGTSLGSGDSGILDPIAVKLKHGRGGIGTVNANEVQLQKSKRNQESFEEDIKARQAKFVSSMQARYSSRLVDEDLSKARLALMSLEEQHGLPRTHLWPPLPKSIPIEGKESISIAPVPHEFEMIPNTEKLWIINNILREKYWYCIWCGTVFDDSSDLRANCPGNERNDHED
jgi:hypothetical protein